MDKPPVNKREFNPQEEAIQKYFVEKGGEKLSFNTPEEAKSKVEEINAEYGDIAFVAEDRGAFAVKLKGSHLGEGFKEYNPEDKKDSSLEEAA